jgi:putative transcriptional regulator
VEESRGPLQGRLLVATPPLVDPNFDRTIVLVLEHGADGALGVVLNRPSETELIEVLPEWREHVSPPDVVFVGGPVSRESVIALARRRISLAVDFDHATPGPRDPDGDHTESWVPVLGDLGTIDLGRDPDDLTPTLDTLRVFVGYAGWGPAQLDAELDQGAWFVVDLHPDDVFTRAPDDLWHRVVRRQRGRIAMFANCPADASVN